MDKINVAEAIKHFSEDNFEDVVIQVKDYEGKTYIVDIEQVGLFLEWEEHLVKLVRPKLLIKGTI